MKPYGWDPVFLSLKIANSEICKNRNNFVNCHELNIIERRKDILQINFHFRAVICKTKERIIRRKEKNKTVTDVQCMGKTNFAKQNYFYAEEEETIEKL